MFKKILIANRGEIAVRVIKTCKEMDISTVAVYSEIDRNSLHVQLADEAIFIGKAPSTESYLLIENIINAAKKVKADAIHPGYGFLAENPLFAKSCEENGIAFIGPNPSAITLLGNKVASRELMIENNIPVVPGMKRSSTNIEEFIIEAQKIGYPVLIKASAGGGGKGMRKVNNEEELKDAVSSARREAKSAFGDESIYLEKYIEKPRHIEFQIMADNYGNVIHLYERECSIQRRHQKIIEETPSLALTPKLREKMGEVAVKVVKSANYNNVGTVEFIFDKDNNFYFLEMNTRIQVEHPVTEMTTGIDLVKAQILIASGEKLPYRQEEIKPRGHAIECRIYAEDPDNNFIPSSGDILFYKEPSFPNIRNDSGIYSGVNISVFYDPILAKLIAYSDNRNNAIKKLVKALDNYIILGIKTPINYLKDILLHPEFIKGNTYTDFIELNMKNWPFHKKEQENLKLALITSSFVKFFQSKNIEVSFKKEMPSPWLTLGKWENA